MQIVINAGGVGTRLWPMSTKNKPKQFCKLIGDKSLLRISFERVVDLVPIENIWVNTNEKFKALIKEQIPEILESNILTEPSRRDTFAAVLAHSSLIAGKTSEDENIIFVGSDHLISPKKAVENFRLALGKIDEELNAKTYEIVVSGVAPTFASTQFGYIQIQPEDKQLSFQKAVKVTSFKEKPNFETASSFFEAGNYFWNIALFAFKYSSLLKIVEAHHPKLLPVLETIKNSGKIEASVFEQIPVEAFDYGIIEKSDNLGVINMQLDLWEDIGNYDTYAKYIEDVASLEQQIDKDVNQIQISGNNNRLSLLDKSKKVAFVGVSNLVVVETEDGMIIIDPTKSSEVKKVAGYFEG
jgi:mannose-1-phosphate guanylyltransferase